MSLIDEFGGYDEAKKFINGECVDGFDVQSLRSALLEYRRENNIFEIGDKIVYPWLDCSIRTYNDQYIIKSPYRHATQKEIAQGHCDD